MLNSEILALSEDCINQLRLSSNTMVSRYHQNNKLYPVNDFPVPGYLGKLSGLMELNFKNDFTANTYELNFVDLYH